MLEMLDDAVTFAKALNDFKRAGKITEIRTQLQASVEEIVQHQNLLERKLTGRLADIARRRAELDELEKRSIQEMLATDKQQRTEVGSAIETFVAGSQNFSNPYTCSTPTSENVKMHAKVENEQKSDSNQITASGPGLLAAGEAQYPVDKDPALRDTTTNALKSTYSLRLKGPGRKLGEFAATGSDAGKLYTRYSAAEEVLPVKESCSAPPAHLRAWNVPKVSAADGVPSPKETLPAGGKVSSDENIGETKLVLQATLEASRAKQVFQGFSSVEEHSLDRRRNTARILDDPKELLLQSDVASPRRTLAERAETYASPPTVPLSTPSTTPTSSTPSSPANSQTSTPAATTPPSPNHTIPLQVFNGTTVVLNSTISISTYTQTAILTEARACCTKRAQQDPRFKDSLPRKWKLGLVSLNMIGFRIILSNYKREDLTFLLKEAGTTSPRGITVRIFGSPITTNTSTIH
ncbi:MAG: hypothetical protein Q9172_001464 [Xanthocarpia lactea]